MGAQDALLAGGRYDSLMGKFGADESKSIGFAAGIERLILAMKSKNQASNSIDFFIVYQQEEMIEESLRLALRLREVGLSIEVDLLRRSFTKQIKSADKSLAENIIIIGKDNFNNGTIVVKNMASGIEEIVSLKNNIDFFLKKTKGTPNEKK